MGQAEIETIDPITLQAVQNGMAVGKSAYQIAVDNGFVGTVQEWLTSLHAVNTFPKNYKANLTLTHVTGYPDIPAPENFSFSVTQGIPEEGATEISLRFFIAAVIGEVCGRFSEPVSLTLLSNTSWERLTFSCDEMEGVDYYVILGMMIPPYPEGLNQIPQVGFGFGSTLNSYDGTENDYWQSPQAIEPPYDYTPVPANYDLPVPGNIAFDGGEGDNAWTMQVTVRAVDEHGRHGAESERMTVTCKSIDGEGSVPAMLSWDAVEGAVWYGISVYFMGEGGQYEYAVTGYSSELSEDLWWFA